MHIFSSPDPSNCRGFARIVLLTSLVFVDVQVVRGDTPRTDSTGPTIVLAKSRSSAGEEFTSPVEIKGAAGIGGLSFDFIYNDKAIELKGIESGSMTAENCTIEADTNSPGRAVVRIVAQQPIEGDGEIFKARLAIRDDAPHDHHPLTLENVRAWRIARLEGDGAPEANDVQLAVQPGAIRVAEGSVPLWALGTGAIVVALILVIAGRSKPAEELSRANDGQLDELDEQRNLA